MNNLCPIWAQYKSFRINLARVRDLWRVCTMEHYRRIDERVPAASRRSTREPGCCKRGHRVGGSSGSTLRFAWEVEPFAMRVPWTARGHHGASGSRPVRSTGAPARAPETPRPSSTSTRGRRGEARCRRRDLFQPARPRPSARVVRGGAAARDPTRTDDAGGAASSAPTGGRELPGARDDQLRRALTTRRPLQIGRSRASCRKMAPAAPRGTRGAENARSRGLGE